MNISSLKSAFDKDGYVYIPGFFSSEEVKRLNEHMQRFIAEGISGFPGNSMV